MYKLICHDDHGAVLSFPLKQSLTLLGTDPDCQISLINSDISPRHVAFSLSREGVFIEVQPGAEVLINGQAAIERQFISMRDTLTFGKLTFRLISLEKSEEKDHTQFTSRPIDASESTFISPEPLSPPVSADVAPTDITQTVHSKREMIVDLAQIGVESDITKSPLKRLDPNSDLESTLPLVPKLIYYRPDGSREDFNLKGLEVLVGRSHQNQIVLKDSSISRVHARLIREGDKIVLEDLQSSNGTQVNHEAITFPVELRSGDQVMFGDVALLFFDPRHPVPLPEALFDLKLKTLQLSGASLRRWKVILPAAGIIAVLAGLIFFLNHLKESESTIATPFPKPVYSARPLSVPMPEAFYRQGVKLFNEGQWEAAAEEFKKVTALNPNYKEVQDFIARCQMHLSATAITSSALDTKEELSSSTSKSSPSLPSDPLEQAKALYVQGEVAKALAVLEKTVSTESKSTAGSRANTMKELILKAQDKFLIGESNFKTGNPTAAKVFWDELLALEEGLKLNSASYFARQIKSYNSEDFVKQADTARKKAKWAEAFQLYERALAASPQDEQAQAGMKSLRAQAKAFYLRAVSLQDKNPEEARQLLQTVLAMTPVGDETNQLAYRQLQRLP